MMPVPQNTDDGSNTKLVGGGSKYFMIDSSKNATNDEQSVSSQRISSTGLFSEQDGQNFLVKDCSLDSGIQQSNTGSSSAIRLAQVRKAVCRRRQPDRQLQLRSG
jgi:raffinose/stachyose/melibiose transport system substrate-binding protein